MRLLALLGWELAAPAAAQVTLVDDGRWRITGEADAGAPQIAVSVDEMPAGAFAALHFAYAGDAGLDVSGERGR